jgi:1-acyl-sn-glycerol-3-phosphate acyltransferase
MSSLKGIIAAAWLAFNSLLVGTSIIVSAAVRKLVPHAGARDRIGAWMDRFIDSWVHNNRFLYRVLGIANAQIQWRDAPPRPDGWYLVIANHQSWSDILVLQDLMADRIPPLKFFVKWELLWLPIIGFSMWLLDFPFLRRYGAEQLARDPSLADVDRRATVAACERFRSHPTSVLIFTEGSRFTKEKHRLQSSPYRHLLTPKIGGTAYVLNALGDRLDRLVDVTLVYPDGVPTFWDFLCGRSRCIEVEIRSIEIPAAILSAARRHDDDARAELKTWIGELWQQKDLRIGERLARVPTGSHV